MTRRDKNKKSFDEIESLKLFEKRVNEFRNLRLIQSGMQWNLTINWEASSGILQPQSEKLDEDDLRSFLLLFRQFIAKQEPIFADRVFNICELCSAEDDFRDEIRKLRQVWKKYNRKSIINLRRGDTDLTSKYILDLWINGYYFHNDIQKRSELEDMLRVIPLHIAQAQIYLVIQNLTQVIVRLGDAITYGLENKLFKAPCSD